jgi:hypothetical protein
METGKPEAHSTACRKYADLAAAAIPWTQPVVVMPLIVGV